jgi:hypothetical protein
MALSSISSRAKNIYMYIQIFSNNNNKKNALRLHLTPIRAAIIKKINNNNTGKDGRGKGNLYTAGGNVN